MVDVDKLKQFLENLKRNWEHNPSTEYCRGCEYVKKQVEKYVDKNNH